MSDESSTLCHYLAAPCPLTAEQRRRSTLKGFKDSFESPCWNLVLTVLLVPYSLSLLCHTRVFVPSSLYVGSRPKFENFITPHSRWWSHRLQKKCQKVMKFRRSFPQVPRKLAKVVHPSQDGKSYPSQQSWQTLSIPKPGPFPRGDARFSTRDSSVSCSIVLKFLR